VDVVLIITNLVGPGPLLKIGAGGHLIEATIPENGA
jgi:hypothetical protein